MASSPPPMIATYRPTRLGRYNCVASSNKIFDLSGRGLFMSNESRTATICCLSIGVLILPAAVQAQAQTPTRPAIAKQVADAYGLASFDQVEAIRYTFHLKAPAGQSVSRSWIWEPKTDQVSYEAKDKKSGKVVKVTYL